CRLFTPGNETVKDLRRRAQCLVLSAQCLVLVPGALCTQRRAPARSTCSAAWTSTGNSVRIAAMTRLVTTTACVGFCLAVWPRPAAAQKPLFIKGLDELTQAMVAIPADEGRVRAAIDTMAEGLA